MEPEKVLSHCWINEFGIPTLDLLIQWCNRPLEEATWEDYNLLARQFPSSRFEDKSYFEEGCTDMNPAPFKTYSRRRLGSGDKVFRSRDQGPILLAIGNSGTTE